MKIEIETLLDFFGIENDIERTAYQGKGINYLPKISDYDLKGIQEGTPPLLTTPPGDPVVTYRSGEQVTHSMSWVDIILGLMIVALIITLCYLIYDQYKDKKEADKRLEDRIRKELYVEA